MQRKFLRHVYFNSRLGAKLTQKEVVQIGGAVTMKFKCCNYHNLTRYEHPSPIKEPVSGKG